MAPKKSNQNEKNGKDETISKQISTGKIMPIGLTTVEAKELEKKHGKNRLVSYVRSKNLDIFFSQFSYPILLLILAAIFLSTVSVIEGISILLIISITIAMNWKREKDTEAKIISNTSEFSGDTRVFRDGMVKRVRIEDIVPGDIVLLKTGMMIPADGIVIKSSECKVDESIFRGEVVDKLPELEVQKSFKPYKSDPASVYAGTFVIQGELMMRVTSIGEKTKYHITYGIREPFSADPKRNDAIGRVKKATDSFTPVVYLASLVILLQLTLDEVPIFTSVVITAAAIVAAVPETVYSIASYIYASSMERMSKFAIIRKESMVDKLGRTTIISTEILKSLSRNEPTVRNLWTDRKEITVTGDGWDTLGMFKGAKSYASIDLLTELAAASTEASLEYANDSRIMDGDPIEGALIVMAMKNRVPINNIRGEWIALNRRQDEKVTITQLRSRNRTTFTMFGPVEDVANRCKSMYSNGKFLKIDKKIKNEMETVQAKMSARGQTVYAFAFAWKKNEPEYFTLLSLIGIYDPPKHEIKKRIETLISSGIRPIIITTESSGKAVNFAREIGVMQKGSKAMICDEIKFLRPEERMKRILDTTVFSESTTEYEKIILDTFRQEGHQVTYIESTGIDSSPFLYSNVALAVESSPDTIKYNAEGIIKNDSYESMIDLIEESKDMRRAIERTFYALFASDLSIFFTIMVNAIIFTGDMVTAMQILLINLIADTAISTSFAKESIYEESLRKKTSKKFPQTGEYAFMLLIALFVSIYIGIFTTLPIFKGFERSLTIGTLLVAVIGIILNSVSIDDSIIKSIKRTSRHIILSISVIVGLMLLAFYVPFLSGIFELKQMSLMQWAYALPMIFSLTLLFEIKKWLNRRSKKKKTEWN